MQTTAIDHTRAPRITMSEALQATLAAEQYLDQVKTHLRIETVKRMTVAEATDEAREAHRLYRMFPTKENRDTYNWWADVVNFKNGRDTLAYQGEFAQPVRTEARVSKMLFG